MGFEAVYLFREIEIECELVGSISVGFYTNLPGGAMALRHTGVLNTSGTLSHRTIQVRLPGDIKGKLYKPRIYGTGQCRLFGMRILAKRIGGPRPIGWQWHIVPGIPVTPPDWSEFKLPIEPTPETWSEFKLPIEPTPENWSHLKLPIRATPTEPEWIDMQVDEIE